LRRDGGDLASVTLNNAGGGKIDVFLEQSFEVVDGPSGPEIHVALTNHAPSEGFPPYVLHNFVDLPDGSSRLWVTGYASVPVTAVAQDGNQLESESSVEAGLHTLSALVDVGPGESSTVVFQLDADDKTASDFGVVHQPLLREPPAGRD
jgi:hypothetical protein